MSKNKGLMVLFAALCCQCLCSQPKVMGIDELYSLAEQQSKSMQAYHTGKESAEEELKVAKAQRLPDVAISASVSYLGNGKLWDRHFGNATKIDMPHFGNNFALEVQQVLYAGGAIKSGIRLSELGVQLSELDWQKNRQEIRFMLAGYYLELHKLNNQQRVLRDNLALTEQVIANMKARREQGTVLKSDITRYELQEETLKLQLVQVEDRCKIINYQLVTTLHLPPQTVIVPDSALIDSQVQALSERDWQQLAMQSNIDLKQSSINVEVNRQKEKAERSELIPHFAIVAADHLDGPITIEVPVLDNNFNYWYVGVGVSYNLSSLFKNNRKLKQAKLNVRRAQETYELAQEQVETSVQAGYVDFLTSFADLRTQEKSVELADENYAVVSNRYNNELALLTDMLDAGNTKLDADLALVNARINVVYNYYKMKYLTHTL